MCVCVCIYIYTYIYNNICRSAQWHSCTREVVLYRLRTNGSPLKLNPMTRAIKIRSKRVQCSRLRGVHMAFLCGFRMLKMFDAAAEARRADTSCGICDPVTPYDQLSPLFTVVTTPLVPTLFANGAIQLPGNIVLAQRHEMNVELAAANCVENNVT